jgi:hypothetical protein
MEITITISCKKGPENPAQELMEQEAEGLKDSIRGQIDDVLRAHNVPSLPVRVDIYVEGEY